MFRYYNLIPEDFPETTRPLMLSRDLSTWRSSRKARRSHFAQD